jgi:hypothetical protein
MADFNKLYKLLEDLIIKKAKTTTISNIEIDYWGEIAKIIFLSKPYYEDVRIFVKAVYFSNFELDYQYLTGQEPELVNWLIRPDIERCVIELEKTILMLS